jgi:hypothetical protein
MRRYNDFFLSFLNIKKELIRINAEMIILRYSFESISIKFNNSNIIKMNSKKPVYIT